MNKNLLSLFCAIVLLFISCNRIDEPTIEKLNPASVDVYVAGLENNKACYWKNGVINYLQNGDGINPQKIIVDNNNVYIFGIKFISITNVELYLWKNNIKYEVKNYLNLPTTSISSFFDFTVKNNTELFVGYEDTGIGSSSFCYWKNGVKTLLPINSGSLPAYIDYYDNNVYTSTTGGGGYFKNNIFYSTQGSWKQNFAQNNNGVHYLYINNNNTELVTYNTNNNANTFTNTTNLYPNLNRATIISDILTNDLYTFSNQISDLYYKNNIQINLTDPNYRSIEDMKALNNNIYMIRSFATFTPPLQLDYQYKVFINNVETQYINGINGTFNSIFVVQN